MSYCAVYLNRIHREKNLPEKPEDPLIIQKPLPCDADFTFVDFVPSVLTYSSSVNGLEYHRFSHLVERANYWIENNSQWSIVNCETVTLSYRHNVTSMVSRWEQQINPMTPLWSPISRGEFETVLRALRLWVQRKDLLLDEPPSTAASNNDETQNNQTKKQPKMKLKYLDFIPKKIRENSFETIDDLLERVNCRLQECDTIFWNIITLETLKIESNSEWTIDPEISLTEESSRQLTILRLYYEEYDRSTADSDLFDNELPNIILGIEDFKPQLFSAGSFFKKPEFELFSSLVQRASDWLASQSDAQFLNAQSIDIKIKSFTKLKTRSCINIENGDYIQFLRIVYYKLPPKHQNDFLESSQVPNRSIEPVTILNQFDILRLCSKVFVATKLDHPLDSMQQRIYNWLHSESNQNLYIVSAETVNIYAKDDDEKILEKINNECFQGNRLGSLNSFTFKAIRIFYCQILEQNFDDRAQNYNSINCSRSTFSLQQQQQKCCKSGKQGSSYNDTQNRKYRTNKSKESSTPKKIKETMRVNYDEDAGNNNNNGNGGKLEKQDSLFGFHLIGDTNEKNSKDRSTSCNCM